MTALRSALLLLLMLCLAACSTPHNSSLQVQQVKILLPQAQKTGATATDRQNWEETIERVRHQAYSNALEHLQLASKQYPDAEPVIQSLLEHPDQAFEMFEGCSNYLSDFEPSGGKPTQDWNHDSIVSYYQNFSRTTQYTRIYSVEPSKHLIVLTCWIGPYWEATASYLYEETERTPQVKSLILPTYDSETGQVIPSKSNINYGLQHYDAENHILTLFHKFTGIGDRGFQATYLLENDEFTLTEFREQREPNMIELPGDFPQVYP